MDFTDCTRDDFDWISKCLILMELIYVISDAHDS